eukprot:TRINITY_DN4853_c0_g1_i1.p2 TRINITY_DN4853_c0_g1~~TRINITY_DN4853_c0_g1_i1.p2  ORF type:complete len:151 (-),score=32.75 TRINITY_DN4853_c0_g1_i1:428-880(-)
MKVYFSHCCGTGLDVKLHNSLAVQPLAGAGRGLARGFCSEHEYEHLLCGLYLPPKQRAAVMALRAFNLETALVGERTREPHLRLMRLLWWQEALDGLFQDRPREHPVLRALQAVLREMPLSRRWFSRLLEARMAEVNREGRPDSLAELEA